MDFQHLSNVHTRRNAQRVEYDIQGSTVSQEWHVLWRKDSGYNTFVTMAACHFVSHRDFSLLSNINADDFIDSRCKLITVVSGEYLYVNNDTAFPVWNTHGSITHFAAFFAENCTEQTFFRCKLSFAFRCYFTYQNIASAHFSTNFYDTFCVQIFQRVFAHIRDFSGNLFWTKFCISCFVGIFFNMNRSINVVTNQTLV